MKRILFLLALLTFSPLRVLAQSWTTVTANNVLNYGADPTGTNDSYTAIMNASSAAGCGRVFFPNGYYMVSAGGLTKPRCQIWEGESQRGNTPTNGVMIIASQHTAPLIAIGDNVGTNTHVTGGLENITLTATGTTQGVGLWLGGDPAGKVFPSADFGNEQTLNNVDIFNFSVGIEVANGAFSNICVNCHVHTNTTGILSPSSASPQEANDFVGGEIAGNFADGLEDDNGSEFHFETTHLDYNGLAIGGSKIFVSMTDSWLEQSSGPMVTIATNGTFIDKGSHWLYGASSGSDTSFINVTATTFTQVSVYGSQFGSSHTVSYVVHWAGTNGTALSLSLFGPNIMYAYGIIGDTDASASAVGITDIPASGGATGRLAGPLSLLGGGNVVYRCVTAGNDRAGALTTVSTDCGSAVDTGLRTP